MKTIAKLVVTGATESDIDTIMEALDRFNNEFPVGPDVTWNIDTKEGLAEAQRIVKSIEAKDGWSDTIKPTLTETKPAPVKKHTRTLNRGTSSERVIEVKAHDKDVGKVEVRTNTAPKNVPPARKPK